MIQFISEFNSRQTPNTEESKVHLKSKTILKILSSIEDVRLSDNKEIEVKFKDPDPSWKDEWQPNEGFIYGSFTQELLNLIEASLNGELEE